MRTRTFTQRKFELVSEKKPAGDQPKAIDKLVKGYGKHERQTLLGITGSGKSLDYMETLLVRDSNGLLVRTEIGTFVENLLTSPQYSGCTQYQDVLHKGYSVLSFDPHSGKVSEKPITQISRHVEDELFKIQLDDNSSITVTADHSCFRFKNGSFELCETRELSIGDALPLATRVPAPSTPIIEVSLAPFVLENKISVKLAVENHGITDQQISILGDSSEHIGSWRLRQILGDTKERGVPLSVARNYARFSSEPKALLRDFRIVGKKGDILPLSLPITDGLLTFAGLYVAEGHGMSNYVMITNQNERLQTICKKWFGSLGLTSKQQGITSNHYSVFLARFFRSFGTHAHNKRMADWVFNLSDLHLGILLRSAYDGDGWVEKNGAVCYLSKSSRLIDDMRYLLLRFGITSRITIKIVSDSKFVQLNITGQENLKRFANHVGFSIDYKQDRLEKHLTKKSNTNVDIVPGSGAIIRRIREQFNLSQKEIASIIGSRQCYVSMLESGQRELSHKRFSLLASWASARDSSFAHLNNLREYNFRRIVSIQRVTPTAGFVYDLAVQDNETFMAGNGGIFVHNSFVMANVISSLNKPALILAHNKTLAAQLYAEMKELFPHNRVEYFVSYYDYYQPESYMPSSDTYIEKDAQINPQIERMRLQATASLFSRSDVIIVASVSCIYGLGNPEDYWNLSVDLRRGETKSRDDIIRGLVGMQYDRNDDVLEPGKFRVRGDTIDVAPSYDNERIIRIELFGDEIERIAELDRLDLTTINELDDVTIFPAKHYVTPDEKIEKATEAIEQELAEALPNLGPLEAMRLEKRTKYDLELIRELGYCNGIENYSVHFDGRTKGQPPFTLIDYFPKDFLFIIDESHQTIPQLHAMYNGDRARKTNLVEHGFRLPCAYDNRPLQFSETEKHFQNVIFVSATPSAYERTTSGQIVEMIIRPTGLLDPTVEVRPSKGQITDVMREVAVAVANGWRVLVTTLTKKMAEDLTDYLGKEQIKVRYLHSDIDTLERTEIIRELRLGTFDVLVGINLLREGLDIPETALVCILDADKEGFLRNDTSLLQTIGRAARNSEGRVIFYADRMTDSMTRAISITHARRVAQEKYNKEHGITPATIVKPVAAKQVDITTTKHLPKSDVPNLLISLQAAMDQAAAGLDFEEAIKIRDRIKQLEKEYGIEGLKADD